MKKITLTIIGLTLFILCQGCASSNHSSRPLSVTEAQSLELSETERQSFKQLTVLRIN